ncbi:metallophosphoesterase [Agriterribacter sp.]|uniref:metallophosphoesterase n=1 Tax=Agriterribacter sp. TaxID=2821509 RepID=UPI002C4B8046|nr:metallophosphoesterase [Agriterribacter sp.]HRP55341.1 metallophosphoesterase family protein [Agriterribacter sp.]
MSLRTFLQRILKKPVARLANRFSSRPNRERVHDALTKLYKQIREKPGKKGVVIDLDASPQKIIVFSDLHKGNKKRSDDFAPAEQNYIAALNYYNRQNYTLIVLGDSEELWKFNLFTVKKHNHASFELEKQFLQRKALIKVFGNHDVFWNNDPFAALQLISIYGEPVHMYEAVLLKYKAGQKPMDIFLTHGHQGDAQSDGNKFSAWFVAKIWAPLQSYLDLNINTPAFNDILKTDHNQFMYEWSLQQHDLVLVTGHTHQPVFESMTHLERLYKQLLLARQDNNTREIADLQKEIAFRRQEYDHVSEDYLQLKPSYFNSGCCCFNDGDITGIEIEAGEIRLIKWKTDNAVSKRTVLEHAALRNLR